MHSTFSATAAIGFVVLSAAACTADGTRMGAADERNNLYRNEQPYPNAQVAPRAVEPNAPIRRQNLYRNEQPHPHANPSSARSGTTAGTQGNTGQGDTLILTQSEADEWKMRPVLSRDGTAIGHVAAVVLNSDGQISRVRVEPDEQIGGDMFAVEPENFNAEPGYIVLAMDAQDATRRARQ